MPSFRPCMRVAVSLLIIFAVVGAPGRAQDQRKVVGWANHRNINTGVIGEPWSKQIDTVELEEILVGGKMVTIGDPFVAGVDWINEIAFRVKNVSQEDITFLQITVTLPELTHSPQIPYLAPCGNRENQKCLGPGEEVDLKIPPGKLYDWVKDQVVHERELTAISRAAIDFVVARTRNQREGMAGCLKTADPRNTCPHNYS